MQHEDRSLLDGELEILHIGEVRLEHFSNAFQLFVRLGHRLLQLSDGLGRSNPGDHVFTLSVNEEFSVKDLFPGGGIASKSHPGSGVFPGIPEDHRLNIDGGAPLGRDAVLAAIDNRAVVHPGSKDRTHGPLELFPGVVREGFSRSFLDELFEAVDQFLDRICIQASVLDVALLGEQFLLESVDDFLKGFLIFIGGLLHSHDDITVHLNEAPIAIPSKAGVLTGGGQRLDRLVIEA